MARKRGDWHPEDIKAAVRKTGATLKSLALNANLSEASTRMALIQPWPRVQTIIAAHLGVPPQTIWPSRYDEAGKPRPRKEITGRATRAPRQKRKAS